MKKLTLSRSKQSAKTEVQVRRKNRKAQMMTPEQAAEEERRFQEQKILASAVRFHSHLATQLCFGGRDPESPSLIKFDAGRWQLEAAQPHLQYPERWLRIEIGYWFEYVPLLQEHLRGLFPQDPDFTLVSNESLAPVICPPVPIGRHKPLELKSLTVQRLDMLARLVELDRAICDALLLNKFGLLPAEYWQAVRKVVDGWRYVLTHAHSRKPIGTPKNYQPKNDPLSFYEPQSLAIHQYDKGVAIPIQNRFFSQDKPNQSDKASGSKMPDPEVSQEDTESTHHPKQ